jgi:hypothetical protein
MKIVRAIATVVSVCVLEAALTTSPASAADVNLTAFTIYPSDTGQTAGLVADGTAAVESVYVLAGAPNGGEDGGSEVCGPFITRPHPTEASPHDGRIYVEGEAHMECGAAPSEMWVDTFLGWIVTRSDGSTTGYHLQQGESTYCTSRRRCPSVGELVARWGWEPHCFDYGTFTAHVVVNYRYIYRGVRFSAQVEGPDISGSYGRGC